jgi:hypothetical protein
MLDSPHAPGSACNFISAEIVAYYAILRRAFLYRYYHLLLIGWAAEGYEYYRGVLVAI